MVELLLFVVFVVVVFSGLWVVELVIFLIGVEVGMEVTSATGVVFDEGRKQNGVGLSVAVSSEIVVVVGLIDEEEPEETPSALPISFSRSLDVDEIIFGWFCIIPPIECIENVLNEKGR